MRLACINLVFQPGCLNKHFSTERLIEGQYNAIVMKLGIDPGPFWILMILNLMIRLITPPIKLVL